MLISQDRWLQHDHTRREHSQLLTSPGSAISTINSNNCSDSRMKSQHLAKNITTWHPEWEGVALSPTTPPVARQRNPFEAKFRLLCNTHKTKDLFMSITWVAISRNFHLTSTTPLTQASFSAQQRRDMTEVQVTCGCINSLLNVVSTPQVSHIRHNYP